MFSFFKWVFNSKAPVRPGCFTQACLLVSAALALPGMLAILRGSLGGGLWLLLSSIIPIVLFGLPAWNAYRRSERIENSSSVVSDQTAPAQPAPAAARENQAEREAFTDEYSPLRDDLRKSGQPQAVEQLNLLINKLDDFKSVLNLKFTQSEVTYHRYLDSGSKVFDGAIRNVESIAAFARSVRSVDANSLVEQLDNMISRGHGDSNAATAIRQRLEMMADGRKHIEALLGSNEEALTAMTRVTTRLAGVTTGVSETSDLDAMIEDLHDMAERTERYNEQLGPDRPVIKLS